MEFGLEFGSVGKDQSIGTITLIGIKLSPVEKKNKKTFHCIHGNVALIFRSNNTGWNVSIKVDSFEMNMIFF